VHLAEANDCSSHIHLAPRFITDEEVQNYLRAADIMALAYEDVPMNPGSVILAMSFGLPVVCVAEGSVPEILGPCLFPYRRGDGTDQARALHAALGDRERLVYLGKVARIRAETAHSPEKVAAGLRRCFEHVFA
jgi:glycosyltransferase involved in cell wall biosynthesis